MVIYLYIIFYAIINCFSFFKMNKKGYTTESGGRQNGFALEPEVTVVSEGESKKSLLVFVTIIVMLTTVGIYFFK